MEKELDMLITRREVDEKVATTILTEAFGDNLGVVENTMGDIGEFLEGDIGKLGLPEEYRNRYELLVTELEESLPDCDPRKVLSLACKMKKILWQCMYHPDVGGDLPYSYDELEQLTVLASIALYLQLAGRSTCTGIVVT